MRYVVFLCASASPPTLVVSIRPSPYATPARLLSHSTRSTPRQLTHIPLFPLDPSIRSTLAYSKPHPLARSISSPLSTPRQLDPPQPFDHRPSTLHVPAVDTRYVRLTPRPLFRSPRSMPYPLNAMSSFSSTARLKTPSTLDLRRHANTTPSRPLHADPALQPTCAFILPSLRSRHRRCTLPSYLAAAPSTANTLAPSMSRTTATSSLYPLDLDLDPALVPLILGA